MCEKNSALKERLVRHWRKSTKVKAPLEQLLNEELRLLNEELRRPNKGSEFSNSKYKI
jgi:hypothetical protein